jgi:hypothetical protein
MTEAIGADTDPDALEYAERTLRAATTDYSDPMTTIGPDASLEPPTENRPRGGSSSVWARPTCPLPWASSASSPTRAGRWTWSTSP